MPVINTNYSRLEELLDSDDELPTEYNEASTTPAYQIDGRFDMIQFKWINNSNTFKIPKQCSIEASSIGRSTDHNEIECAITPNNANNCNVTPIVQRGVLNKHDLFCLKSIEGFTGDSTFIWLLNFLIHKDLQSDYMFPKSCLVSNTLNNGTFGCKYGLPREIKHCYTLYIKT